MVNSTNSPVNSITTVVFDYGMVLSASPDPAAWERMKTIARLPEEKLHEAYWHFRHNYDEGALTGTAYWQAVGERAGVALSASQMEELKTADVDLWTVPNEAMIQWAQRLQAAGVRTGILSNIGDDIAAGIIARVAWLSGFNHCTWSHELFMAKPETEIFLRTAAALGVSPGQILFVDDKPENVAAAESVGMTAIQYGNHGDFEKEMHLRGFSHLLQPESDASSVMEPA